MKRSEELSTYIEALIYRMKVSELNSCNMVSLQELQVLSFVGTHQGAKMTEIAEHLLISLSNLTAIVDKLVAKGLVRRERSDEDRRLVLANLTAEGEAIAEANRKQKHLLAEQMLSVLDDGEQVNFMVIMRKIVGAMNGE